MIIMVKVFPLTKSTEAEEEEPVSGNTFTGNENCILSKVSDIYCSRTGSYCVTLHGGGGGVCNIKNDT